MLTRLKRLIWLASSYLLGKQLMIEDALNGWEFPMNDMVLNNELTDMKIVNLPDFVDK